MFRLPKSSNQSPGKKPSNLVVNPVVSGNTQKNQGLCKFAHRKCNFVCLDNYNYCLKHILEDKSAPYKPCPFLYTVSGKKCGKPALRQERKDTWFCAVHNRKTHLQRQRACSRHAPPKTQEALFATLGHYVPPEKPAVKREEAENEESSVKEEANGVDPFVDIDASQVNTRVSQVLDYVSESDSDVDTAMLDSVWRAQDHESSDAESVDSQNEDPLKHAGTYTAEEVTIIIKDKMLRLQSLYIDQFRRLHHLLKEKRRKYLHTLKKEKETLCSIHDQEKQTAREQKLYEKLKSLNRYHKHYGVEAILHKKALELRAQVTEGHQLRTSHKGKCAFTEGGVKCGAKTLPVTKYCRKHILEDTQQVLFRSCGVKRDDHICQEPTLNVFENSTCVYHTVLPAQPHDKLGKPEIHENQSYERGNTQIMQNESENSFVNAVDSEDLLIKDILKPAGINSSGKAESVDALELSRTVSDILALAEAHASSTELGQTLDKPYIDQNIEATSSGNAKPFTIQGMEASSSETTKSVGIDQSFEASLSEPSKPVSDQNMEASCSETSDAKYPSLCEKMDVVEEQKQAVSSTVGSTKQETSEDLVMVDMMTDVGVVEEVLEAEQLVVDSVEVVNSEQEVGGGEEEAMGSELQVVGSKQQLVVPEQMEGCDHQVDAVQQVVGSEQQVVGSEQVIVGSDPQLVETDQQVVETEQQVVETDQQVAETDQQVVETDQQVVKTDQQVVVSAQELVGSEKEVVGTEQEIAGTKQEVVGSEQLASSLPETARLGQETKEKDEEPMEVDTENENQPENG